MIYELDFIEYCFYGRDIIPNIEENKKKEVSYWMDLQELKSEFQPKIVLDRVDKEEFRYYVYTEKDA